MAAARSLLSKLPFLAPRAAVFPRLRPLAAAGGAAWCRPVLGAGAGAVEVRAFSTRPTTSSLNDPQPNWSNRPPKETILLEGCDFEHWLVVVDPPEPNLTREEIIDSYIKKLAEVLGSEEEARSKIYSVSTKHYFAFGALVSEELSYKIKALQKVRWVLPDSYLDVRNKDYGGEPFIDGQAAPYDPKYHEEWVRNNARANERNRRNDRPRNNDRSRNFERRQENMQNFQRGPPQPNQDFQNPMPPRDGPPMPNNAPPNPIPSMNMPPVQSGNLQTGPPNFNANNAGPPRGGYPNQIPNSQNSYAPSGPPPPSYNQGYQGGNPAGPVSQGYNQGYQGGNSQGYNGGGPNYQQGRAPNYPQGGYPQQGGNPGYNPTSNAGGQGGGEGPNYYQQPGQGGAPYQGNMPGRD